MDETQVSELAETGKFLDRIIGGRVVETHISWVILARPYVFKIKKPIKLSFLDFSSLAKRKKYCDRELELNKRFSPVYLDVLPVCRHEGCWIIGGGKGRVVDYVVRMKRLMTSKQMDRLLKKNRVTREEIIRLAKVVSTFHSKAAVCSQMFSLQKFRAAFNDIGSIIHVIQKYAGAKSAQLVRKSMQWSDIFLAAHADRIKERISLGFFRDVHGDLHSGNIFLYKAPVLFDCIEFNDGYRRIDLINEIAFLCMDLEAHGKQRMANLFIREYQRDLVCIDTPEDDRLIVYYKCYRANVRAKVHALSAEQTSEDPEVFRSHINALRNYLRLMRNYIEA